MTLDTIRMLYTVQPDGTPKFATKSAVRKVAEQVPSLVTEVEYLRVENARLRRQLQDAAGWKALVDGARATAAHASAQETTVQERP